jgi:hypothetical protein
LSNFFQLIVRRCLTNKENNLSPLVLVYRINMSQISRKFAPHFGYFVRITVENSVAADTPQITPFKYEYFSSNYSDGIVGCITSFWLFMMFVVMMPGCGCWMSCRYRRIIAWLFWILWRIVRVYSSSLWFVWISWSWIVASRCCSFLSCCSRVIWTSFSATIWSPLFWSIS